MNRVLVIDSCDSCPYFDNEYYHYSEECTRLNRCVKRKDIDNYPIPDDCPLFKTEDETTDV